MDFQQEEVFICFQDPSLPNNSSVASIVSGLPSSQIKVYDHLDCGGGYLRYDELPAAEESKGSLIRITRRFVRSRLCMKKLDSIIKNWARYSLFPVFLNVLFTDLVKERINYDAFITDEERYVAETVDSDRRRDALTKTAAGRSAARNERASEFVGEIFDEKLNSNSFEPLSINQVKVATRIRRSKGQCFVVMTILLVINLLLEIASVVADQLSSVRRPYFSTISVVMSTLSVFLSIIDLTYKIQVHKVCFRCKWPIPWFYYTPRNFNRGFGSFSDMILLFCGVGQLIVSTINCIFIQKGRAGPINVSVWPLFFAIAMVISKFMEEPTISKEN